MNAFDEARHERDDAACALSVTRSASQKVRDYMATVDINSTKELVAKFNAETDDATRETIVEWLNEYVSWFSRAKVESLSDDMIVEYTSIVQTIADDEKGRQLLHRFFISFCNKIKEGNQGELKIVEALTRVLQAIDIRVLQEETVGLLHLASDLLNKLGPNIPLRERILPSLSPVLSALHLTFVILQDVAPRELNPHQQEGPYRSFKSKLASISSRAECYPFLYQVKVIEQSLERLASCRPTVKKAVQRFFLGALGMLQMYHGIRSILAADVDIQAIETGYRTLKEAISGGRARQRDWFDLIQILNAASLLCSEDPERYEEFKETYHMLLEGQSKKRKEDQKPLRFALIADIRSLAVNGLTASLRERAVHELLYLTTRVATDQGWLKDSDISNALFDACQAASASEEYHSLILQELKFSFFHKNAPFRKQMDSWLDGKRLEVKLTSQLAVPARVVASGRLFNVVKKEFGLGATGIEARENIQDLKHRYQQKGFAEVESLFYGNLPKHVECFKHSLMLSETVKIDDRGRGYAQRIRMAVNDERRSISRTPILLQDLFTDRFLTQGNRPAEISKVLISGFAGTGKTSISKRIAFDWSLGNWGSQFEALFVLPVRELNASQFDDNGIRRQKCLETAIANLCFSHKRNDADYEALRNQIARCLNKRNTLLIFDGLDEADSVGIAMIRQEEKWDSKVLFLSRPCDIREEQLGVDIEVECLGLSDTHLKELIESELNEESARQLMQHLRASPSLWDIAHVPITAQILCAVWREKQDAEPSFIDMGSTTLTLYDEMTVYVWKRYVRRSQNSNANRKDVFKVLEAIALDAINAGQILISSSLIEEHATTGEMRDVLDHCGFLSLKTVGSNFEFPHSTYQEYFAAKHLVECLCDERGGPEKNKALTFFKERKYLRSHQALIPFAAQKICQTEKLSGFLKMISAINEEPIEVTGVEHLLLQLEILENALSVAEPETAEKLQRNNQTNELVDCAGALLLSLSRNRELLDMLVRRLENFRCVIQKFPSILDPVIDELRSVPLSLRLSPLCEIARVAWHNESYAETLVQLASDGHRSQLDTETRRERDFLLSSVESRHESVELVKKIAVNAASYGDDRARNAARIQFVRLRFLNASTSNELSDAFSFAMKVLQALQDNNTNEDSRLAATVDLDEVVTRYPDGADKVLELLESACRDDSWKVRCAAYRRLPSIVKADPEKVDDVWQLVKSGCDDDDWCVRKEALLQISDIMAAVPREMNEVQHLLAKAAADRTMAVRNAAKCSLEAIAVHSPEEAYLLSISMNVHQDAGIGRGGNVFSNFEANITKVLLEKIERIRYDLTKLFDVASWWKLDYWSVNHMNMSLDQVLPRFLSDHEGHLISVIATRAFSTPITVRPSSSRDRRWIITINSVLEDRREFEVSSEEMTELMRGMRQYILSTFPGFPSQCLKVDGILESLLKRLQTWLGE